MADNLKTRGNAAHQGLNEAERMARIRDLLVGPVIADESARVDQSLERIGSSLTDQGQALQQLTKRLERLEALQETEIRRLDLRLLGMAEALLADESSLRARIADNKQTGPALDKLTANGAEPTPSG